MSESNKIDMILERAKGAKKEDYSVYNMYKRELESLLLNENDYKKAILRLIKILRV